ncbi:MAG: hypothetical protein AAGC71_06685 [Pseudomonadota bacterium]
MDRNITGINFDRDKRSVYSFKYPANAGDYHNPTSEFNRKLVDWSKEEIITMLRGMGIDYAQGYGVSEPKKVLQAIA